VAEELGGAERMLHWAQADAANERLFWWQIFPKLLPRELKAEHSGPDGAPLSSPVLVVPVPMTRDEWLTAEDIKEASTSPAMAADG
jgi:hypothetical protein